MVLNTAYKYFNEAKRVGTHNKGNYNMALLIFITTIATYN